MAIACWRSSELFRLKTGPANGRGSESAVDSAEATRNSETESLWLKSPTELASLAGPVPGSLAAPGYNAFDIFSGSTSP